MKELFLNTFTMVVFFILLKNSEFVINFKKYLVNYVLYWYWTSKSEYTFLKQNPREVKMLNGKKIAALLSVMLVAFNSVTADSVKPNGSKGPVLCPTFPIIGNIEDCGYTWHVDLGLLYQQPGFSGMNAGTSYSPVFEETTNGFQNQAITNLQQSFDYSLGLTVSLGHLIQHDEWFVLARFDWMNATTTTDYDNPNLYYGPNANFNYDVLIDTDWINNSNSFSEINYSADISIYALDVLLSRGSYHSKCFSYEPFMGVKALWYNDSQTSNYYSTTLSTHGYIPTLVQSQDNWGVGPMFGFNGEYHITNGLSLFSDSDIAILYGQSYNNSVSSVSAGTATVTEAQIISNNTQNDCQYYVPVRSIIGIKLDSYCLEDSHYVAIKLGYDARAVLTAPLILTTTSSASGTTNAPATGNITTVISNDIFMSGLYANFEWDF